MSSSSESMSGSLSPLVCIFNASVLLWLTLDCSEGWTGALSIDIGKRCWIVFIGVLVLGGKEVFGCWKFELPVSACPSFLVVMSVVIGSDGCDMVNTAVSRGSSPVGGGVDCRAASVTTWGADRGKVARGEAKLPTVRGKATNVLVTSLIDTLGVDVLSPMGCIAPSKVVVEGAEGVPTT